MSMQVPVEFLPEVVRGYGQSAYAVVSDPAGPPRVTHVMPTFSGETLTFGLGRTSCALLETNPHLSVLWPAVHAETMSLIVDADVLGCLHRRHGDGSCCCCGPPPPGSPA